MQRCGSGSSRLGHSSTHQMEEGVNLDVWVIRTGQGKSDRRKCSMVLSRQK